MERQESRAHAPHLSCRTAPEGQQLLWAIRWLPEDAASPVGAGGAGAKVKPAGELAEKIGRMAEESEQRNKGGGIEGKEG